MNITKVTLKKSFSIVPLFGNASQTGEEPTWVPKWLSTTFRQRSLQAEYLLLPPIRKTACDCKCGCWFPGETFPVWKSHGNSKQEYTIKGKVLRARGRLLGSIHTLSSTLEEACQPSYIPMKCSTTKPRRPLSHRSIFISIFYLLTFTNADCRCKFCAVTENHQSLDFCHIFSCYKLQGMLRLSPTVHAWLVQNKDMDIFGRRLSRCISVPKGPHDCFRYLTHTNSGDEPMASLIFPLMLAYRVTRAVVRAPTPHLWKRLQLILEMNMRLATSNLGLGWVSSLARPGDQICVLQGSNVLAVLRPRETGGWTVVGDAIFYGAMNGEYMDEAKCEFLDIY